MIRVLLSFEKFSKKILFWLAALKTRLMAKKLFPALLDLVDHEITERVINNSSSKRKLYVKYSREECYKIRKYASEDGPIATVSKFQQRFANKNERTARTFRKRYELDLADAKRQGKTLPISLPLKPESRPFLLGKIDEMVQC